ncbi:hypothetical protein ACO2Q8_16480 [Larkinella sp. VNQ87]|uniref:hypothetical protein n=1 Tax=Larkinella sp. VNQ87 TaxID=3400921 RepID=UPI003C0EE93A
MKLKNIVETIRQGIDRMKGEEAVDKTFCSQNVLADELAARNAFNQARERLFAINRWSNLSSLTADFMLHDSDGNPKTGQPEIGDSIRIDLPGPVPENWVRVVELVDEENKAGFTARPCADPRETGVETEHFFTDEATSTFWLERQGTALVACQIGENEQTNNHDEQAGGRAVVNTAIAGTGWLFYQKIQWKTLTDYLVGI